MLWEVHVCAWLPYARIDNLLWELPDREQRGPRAAGPFLQGDGFVLPPATVDALKGRSLRAWQHLALPVHHWGDAVPLGPVNVTTVPLNVLAADGSTCVHSEPSVATRSTARLGFNP